MRRWLLALSIVGMPLVFTGVARADQVTLWDTLAPNPALAITSQNNVEIPSSAADDFFYLDPVAFRVDEIRVQGLLTDPNATITGVKVELYQTFPFNSDKNRTPATTRTNGPADDEFVAFDSSTPGDLSFSVKDLGPFTVANVITPGSETQEGSFEDGFTGDLREITIKLDKRGPVLLPAANAQPTQINHYFLEVTVETSSGEYFWMAGQRPPFVSPAGGDRQAWMRTDPFNPDWRRVSDVINNSDGTATPAINTSFRITGHTLAVRTSDVQLAVREMARILGAVLQGP
jgi:hypothetical protein